MKTFLHRSVAMIVIAIVFFTKDTKSQGVYFASGVFQAEINGRYPSCAFPDGSTDVTCSAILNEDTLDLRGLDISSFDGLQYFTSLRYLDISNNASGLLAGDDFTLHLPPSLKVLKCTNMDSHVNGGGFILESLPPTLEYLDCSGNSFSGTNGSLPPLPATLKYLNCSNNGINQAISVPAVMDTLICNNNANYYALGFCTGISAFSSFPSTLKYLDCSGNKLTSLPALPASLTYLDCSFNVQEYSSGPNVQITGGITALPTLPSNLKYLACGINYITSIPTLPSTLEYFSHYGYMNYVITSLPALPPNLRVLIIGYNNDVTSLPPFPDSLRTLNVSGNPHLGCLPHLPAHLTGLTTYGSNIHCIPNSVNGLVSDVTTLCTITNNSNLCIAFPVVSGYVFYDNNNNGIKDPAENYRANVGIQLSNGLETYSNTNGFFNITADSGMNTLTVVAPNYYDAVPATTNFNMPTFSSTVSQDIALQANVNIDSVTVSITPEWYARPGFDQWYNIAYENVGTTVVAPSTVFHYDNTRLTFISATNPSVIDNGSSLTLTEGNFTTGQQGGYDAVFNVKPAAIVGDTIFVNVVATAGSSTVTDSSYTRITASLDPNDKNSTPKLSPQQVTAGKYIDYIVRFQNTGSDTAFNIVVTDVLDNKLDATTLQMIKTSHPCKVTRNGSNLSFEFLNVLLPDMTANEPASHGYIRFRVKPKQTVILGDVIPNNANIYFDFNSPVLTNTTNTVIQLTTVPLSLLSFKALSGTDNSALLFWNTADEFNTSSFDIEQSIDGRIFNRIGSTVARGSGNNTYSYKTIIPANIVYYRLKMIDIDGRYTYSQVIQVKRSKQSESVIVLSNPTKNTLSLIMTDATLVNTPASIINEQGLVVKRFVLNDGLQNIDVSILSTGIYYLKTAATIKKIVINH
ncbi:MAG: hypothetical protein ABI402_15750 [Ferruginibacter sp.]